MIPEHLLPLDPHDRTMENNLDPIFHPERDIRVRFRKILGHDVRPAKWEVLGTRRTKPIVDDIGEIGRLVDAIVDETCLMLRQDDEIDQWQVEVRDFTDDAHGDPKKGISIGTDEVDLWDYIDENDETFEGREIVCLPADPRWKVTMWHDGDVEIFRDRELVMRYRVDERVDGYLDAYVAKVKADPVAYAEGLVEWHKAKGASYEGTSR